MKKKIEVTLSWKQLELISSYYSFPTVVFLLSEKNMKKQLKGKRDTATKKTLKKIRKLIEQEELE